MAAESAAKRLKTDSAALPPAPVTIGTHNGHFHADEALAVYILRTHVPRYAGAAFLRTRDPAALAACDTVVDVGGEYDPPRRRFDHHQRGFDATFPGRATKLSSAGLVFLHFGKDVIARRRLEVLRQRRQQQQQQNTAAVEAGADADADADAEVDLLHDKLYETFIEAVDANDNGVAKYDADALRAAGIEQRFSSGGFTLGAMVARLNPNWNDPAPSDPAEAQTAEDARFAAASHRIGEEFDRSLDYYLRAWLPARDVVEKAFRARRQYDPRGRIMVFVGQSGPWKAHLYAIEEEEGKGKESRPLEEKPSGEKPPKEEGEDDKDRVLYVLYPEKPAPGAKWRVQAVPESENSFQSRKALPEAWRGFRDEELDGISGVQGCVFVHASGFIGGNKTFEGALELAKKALEM